MSLSLTGGGNSAASLQWQLQFPATALSAISATPGAALTAAGKSLSCQAANGSYMCIASGSNSTAIGDGVIAVITATASQATAITVTNQMAASPAGAALSLTATGGSIALPGGIPTLSSLVCNATSLAGVASVPCTVTLSAPATAATTIALSINHAGLTVPASVTVAAGASSAQFTATSSGSTTATVTLSATLGSVTKTVSLTLSASAGPILSSLVCTPTSIAGASSTACTVTLSGPAATATTVALSSNNTALIVPASATVLSGVSTAQFAPVSSGAMNATVTLTATLNGTSKTFNLALTTSTFSMRVHTGGAQFVDPQGYTWNADTGYSGGSPWSTSYAVANTNSPALYQSVRWGSFGYQFTVPNGNYTVNLKFAEVSLHSIGQRIFSVALNGTVVLPNFDIVAAAGGPLVPVDKAFPVTVTNGSIQIGFLKGAADQPAINAIEIVQQGTPLSATATPPPSTFTPLYINSGGSGVLDSAGITWTADQNFTGGTAWSTAKGISNTTMPQLYQSCRYGNMYYPIAVPNGTYNVTLKFAEISLSSVGQRVFNVQINGVPVLSNFDIVAAVGAPYVAVDKTFSATVTNGVLMLGFNSGSANLPLINAIEVVK